MATPQWSTRLACSLKGRCDIADFTATTGLVLQLNTGTNGAPVWTTLQNGGSGGANELRFSDQSNQGATASASWPYMTRPGSTQAVPYQYAFTADTTSLGLWGTTSNTPISFVQDATHYLSHRWSWDAVGTFASAPIFTAYASSAHASITRGDASLLGGHATDTGGTARSYLKGVLWGRVTSAGAPATNPTAFTVTDGATGSVAPTAGANWSANQGLQGDNDFLTAAATPAATTADSLNMMIDLFTGPNMATGTYTNVISCKYTFA
jgi:hypothetical protein